MSTLERTRRSVGVGRHKSYGVEMVDDLLGAGLPLVSERIGSRRALLVASPTVARLYADRLCTRIQDRGHDVSMLVVDCLERGKTFDRALDICERLIGAEFGRRDVVVGVGGGVCTDLVTLASSLFRRGIDYIRIPTTLIGQVDAGIGIKGAVNFGGRKNILGCFHPPSSVLIDPGFLRTLPLRHVRCGLAEVVKMAIARDPMLFEAVERDWRAFSEDSRGGRASAVREIIWRSVVAMLDELETNFYEDQSHERLVDLGHTFSPALESRSGFELHHGEAVAIDIALSAALARQIRVLDAESLDRILSLLLGIGLPIWTPLLTLAECQRSLEEASQHRGGRPNLVVPVSIGASTFVRRHGELSETALRSALQLLQRRASRHTAGPLASIEAEPPFERIGKAGDARSA